jgi:hypothetical protein
VSFLSSEVIIEIMCPLETSAKISLPVYSVIIQASYEVIPTSMYDHNTYCACETVETFIIILIL